MNSVKTARTQPRFKKSNAKVEGYVNGRISSGSKGPEIKNYDLTAGPTAVNTGTPLVLDCLGGIAEGTNDSQRVGMKILIKSVDVEANITATVGATATVNNSVPCFIDAFLVWDKQPDGSTAAASTIFTSSATDLVYGLPANLDRFQVLRRERYAFDLAGKLSERLHWHVPMDIASKFPDATSAPNSNGIILVFLTNSAAAATTVVSPNVTAYFRVKFTDA